jgi:hypothetical protein
MIKIDNVQIPKQKLIGYFSNYLSPVTETKVSHLMLKPALGAPTQYILVHIHTTYISTH